MIRIYLTALIILLFPATAAAQIHRTEQIEVELVAETANAVPGETLWLGIRLKPAEHWHTYWKFGGDSGEATETSDWRLPQGMTDEDVGGIVWPAPEWTPFLNSGLVTFTYPYEVILPLPVRIPARLDTAEITLATTIDWQVCEEICIPGAADFSITLPVSSSPRIDRRWQAGFQASRDNTPVTDHPVESFIAVAGERVSLAFRAEGGLFADVREAWFFPEQRRIIKPGPLRDVSIEPNLVQITHRQPRRMVDDPQVYGVLVTESRRGDRRAYQFTEPARDAAGVDLMAAVNGGSGGGSGSRAGLPLYMLFALLGGLILNLMPCVFPVLSIKALSIAKSAGETARRQRLDGLAYTAGVILAFIVLATVLIVLREGGERIGWAFQFQQPWFLAFIIYLFFMMGLSLSGVFDIGTGLMGAGDGLTRRKGYQGSFFTGMLATTVATPCTAPFMGPALGFALTQPWTSAMVVFIALGLGMALPILLLSFLPVLSRYLPRPGPWMETFKQFMAFPLYASALFFVWVLGNQVGVMGMSLVMAACVLLAFAAWLYQRRLSMGAFMRAATVAVVLAALGVAGYVTRTPFMQTLQAASPGLTVGGGGAETAASSDYEPFSSARVDELRAAGKPVFINMTAAWCITCLANEQTSLSADRVRRAMDDNGITYLKGDWTNEDPEITAVLEEFNRPSVPLYILYPAGQRAEPVILPQILTPGILVDAFNDASE